MRCVPLQMLLPHVCIMIAWLRYFLFCAMSSLPADTVLHLQQWRHAALLQVPLPAHALLVAPNGTGKTNVLEAAAMLGMAKSFRAGNDKELLQAGGPWWRIALEAAGDEQLAVFFGPEQAGGQPRRQYLRAGVQVALPDYLGALPTAVYHPGSVQLVLGGPDERRAWLDALLCQRDAGYLAALAAYKQVLRQRASLLAWHPVDAGQLALWDAQLASHGWLIMRQRRQALEQLAPLISSYAAAVAGVPMDMTLRYTGTAESEAELLAQVQAAHGRDARLRQNTVGPHRDDVLLHTPVGEARRVCSRGEAITLTLAAVLAQADALAGQGTQLVLDDPWAELDPARAERLGAQLAHWHRVLASSTLPQAAGWLPTATVLGADVLR